MLYTGISWIPQINRGSGTSAMGGAIDLILNDNPKTAASMAKKHADLSLTHASFDNH